MTKLFESEDYVRRPLEVTVDGLTGEMAAWLVSHPMFARVRTDARGSHPAVYAYLTAVTVEGQKWVSSVRGTPVENTPEQAEDSRPWLTSREAADLLDVEPRAVLQAIARGRLKGERDAAGPWRLKREDVEHYRASRAA